MKTLKVLLVFFMCVTFLSGCGVRQVNAPHQNEPLQNTTTVGDKQAPPQEDFIPGFHPFKDDPDNPSPYNPLVRKFGDIPAVRTYIRLNQKFLYGIGLTVDEAIEFYTAEAQLYPSLESKARLKAWKKDKERYQRLGLPMDSPVLGYNVKAEPREDAPAHTK